MTFTGWSCFSIAGIRVWPCAAGGAPRPPGAGPPAAAGFCGLMMLRTSVSALSFCVDGDRWMLSACTVSCGLFRIGAFAGVAGRRREIELIAFDVVEARGARRRSSSPSTKCALPRKSARSTAPSPGFVSTMSRLDVAWRSSAGDLAAAARALEEVDAAFEYARSADPALARRWRGARRSGSVLAGVVSLRRQIDLDLLLRGQAGDGRAVGRHDDLDRRARRSAGPAAPAAPGNSTTLPSISFELWSVRPSARVGHVDVPARSSVCAPAPVPVIRLCSRSCISWIFSPFSSR